MIQFAFRFFLFLTTIFVIAACSHKIESNQFLKWLSEDNNGLIKIKKSNGFEIKMKYLPAEYFVSRELLTAELKKSTKDKTLLADSIKAQFSNNIYFLLHIDNDTSIVYESADVMFRNVDNYKDYASRIYKFNFDMGDDIELIKDNKTYHPVLTSFENHYGLEGGRNLLLVFSPEKNLAEFSSVSDLEIVFNDEELGIGTTHFRFRKSDIENIPELIY